jgi:hypothetical protein
LPLQDPQGTNMLPSRTQGAGLQEDLLATLPVDLLIAGHWPGQADARAAAGGIERRDKCRDVQSHRDRSADRRKFHRSFNSAASQIRTIPEARPGVWWRKLEP